MSTGRLVLSFFLGVPAAMVTVQLLAMARGEKADLWRGLFIGVVAWSAVILLAVYRKRQQAKHG